MQTLTLGTTSDSDSVLIVLKADDDVGFDAERVERALHLLGVELEVMPARGKFYAPPIPGSVKYRGEYLHPTAGDEYEIKPLDGCLQGKLMSDEQIEAIRKEAYEKGKADSTVAFQGHGLYTRGELDAAVQAAKTKQTLLNVGDVVTQDYQYGDYITVYPFVECTIPAPSEHGYTKVAGHISKDLILADGKEQNLKFYPQDLAAGIGPYPPNTVPVIITVLR